MADLETVIVSPANAALDVRCLCLWEGLALRVNVSWVATTAG